MAQLETVVGVMALISAAFPAAKFTDAATDLWAELLADVPDVALVAATKDIIGRATFPPSLGEVRTRAFDLAAGRAAELTGAEAWLSFLDAMHHRIRWTELPDAVTRAIGSDPTWLAVHIREGRVSESVVRAQFVKTYDAIRERQRHATSALPVVRNLLELGLKQNQIAEYSEELVASLDVADLDAL